jgi:hypothetical protein
MFTGLRTARKALQQAQDADARAWKVEKLCAELQERLESLQFAHAQLRGKFYATKAEPKIDAEKPLQPATREERRLAALAKAGYTPGKPIKLEN